RRSLLPTVCSGILIYRPFFATKWTRSASRQEYPHSLSYQETTLTRLPPTEIVSSAEKIEECVLPLRSVETSGSSVYSTISFIGPPAASFTEALTSSIVASRESSAVKSTTETVGVGTRKASPVNLP